MSTDTPEQVLASIVEGINAGNLEALMTLYEPDAGFASQPGTLAPGLTGVRQSLAAFIGMKGTLDLQVTRVLQASDLALVVGKWSFTGTGPDGGAVRPGRDLYDRAARNPAAAPAGRGAAKARACLAAGANHRLCRHGQRDPVVGDPVRGDQPVLIARPAKAGAAKPLRNSARPGTIAAGCWPTGATARNNPSSTRAG